MTTEEQQAYDAIVAERDAHAETINTLTTANTTLTADIEQLRTVDLAVALETVETYKTQSATTAQLVTALQKENARLVMNAEQPTVTDAELFAGLGRKGRN